MANNDNDDRNSNEEGQGRQTSATMEQEKNTSDGRGRQGFATMDQEKQREIASKGGKSQGKESNPGNFANNPERAREAGRKGGSS